MIKRKIELKFATKIRWRMNSQARMFAEEFVESRCASSVSLLSDLVKGLVKMSLQHKKVFFNLVRKQHKTIEF